ncbi:rhomboid family intramembrane serine protease [Puteibacter caeruleilacunae]|nr:rhomboid family intramembrane serine protease [Puteibacter caeruleilacunae]
MKEILIQFRRIYVRYLILAVCFIIGYSALRSYFDYELGIIHLKKDLLDYWLPLGVAFILVLVWLRPRLRILSVCGSGSRTSTLYYMVAVASMFVPTFIAQNYMEASNSHLIEVDSPYEITEASSVDCYNITDFNVLPWYGGAHSASRTGGRNSQDLYFTIYFVVPLVDNTQQLDNHRHKYWYAFKEKKRISNYGSDDEKNEKWRAFYDESVAKYENYQFADYEYLQGLPYSDDRDGYIEAVRSRQKNNFREDLVILEPIDEPFEDKAGSKFAWIFGSFGIGAFVFLIMVLGPSIDQSEYRQFKEKRPVKDDDTMEFLKFLIPRGNHVVTAVLLNVNLLVFIVLVFTGISVMSATPKELLELGANRRYEVLKGEHWRLFTSMFLHNGFMHLLMNLFGIGATCALTEARLGSVRTLLAYVLSGIGGSLMSIYWHENTVSVGASGAVFGMMGVMIALLLTKKQGDDGGFFLIILGLFGGVSLLFGFLGGIDNAAHIGGLLTGIMIGFILILTKWNGVAWTALTQCGFFQKS